MFRQASSEVWRTVVASALAQMGVACWEYDLVSGELWWSENAGPLVGRPSGFTPSGFEEAEQLFVREIDRPWDLAAIVAQIQSAPVEVDRRAVLPDGTVRWTHHRYFVITDAKGRPERLAGMMADIDTRKRREAEDAALLEASEVLGHSLDVETTLAATARLLVPDMADWCVVELLEEGRLRNVVNAHVDPAKVKWAEAMRAEYPPDMDAPMGAPNVVRTGEPEWYPDISDELMVAAARGDDRLLDMLRNVGYRSAMVVPLSVGGKPIGAVTMVMAESARRFDQRSLDFASRLARHMALAIENARLHSDLVAAWNGQREAVNTLQRGLSPDPLPNLAGLTLAAHYQIGGTDKVGGDWYDAFPTHNGQQVALVIGDVAGRGVPAVAAMSRYRNALKLALFRGDTPGAALSWVNRFGMSQALREKAFATVVCLTYHPASMTLIGARAGHPMPLIRRPDGQVQWFDGMADPPFSTEQECEYSEKTIDVEAGTLLVLYTDGLIERRDENIDVSMKRLAARLTNAPEAPEKALEYLLEGIPTGPSTDDVAILAVRFDH